MKQNSAFLLREVAGTLVIVPVGKAAAEFSGMITLNATSAYLWQLLETEQTVQTLTDALVARYEVQQSKAQQDVESFVSKLKLVGAITEDAQ
ncbi:MAG: PqqD family protein [Clostridia bacterium]|nr:PqqD family protein [Oscillospiraceae bacterium]MBO7162182.1 PqqD family protein [Clostridia bacterium]